MIKAYIRTIKKEYFFINLLTWNIFISKLQLWIVDKNVLLYDEWIYIYILKLAEVTSVESNSNIRDLHPEEHTISTN